MVKYQKQLRQAENISLLRAEYFQKDLCQKTSKRAKLDLWLQITNVITRVWRKRLSTLAQMCLGSFGSKINAQILLNILANIKFVILLSLLII